MLSLIITIFTNEPLKKNLDLQMCILVLLFTNELELLCFTRVKSVCGVLDWQQVRLCAKAPKSDRAGDHGHDHIPGASIVA